jgi:hypothetical protein
MSALFLVFGLAFFVGCLHQWKYGAIASWLLLFLGVLAVTVGVQQLSTALWQSLVVSDDGIMVRRGFPLPAIYVSNRQWRRFRIHRAEVLDQGGGTQISLSLIDRQGEPTTEIDLTGYSTESVEWLCHLLGRHLVAD